MGGPGCRRPAFPGARQHRQPDLVAGPAPPYQPARLFRLYGLARREKHLADQQAAGDALLSGRGLPGGVRAAAGGDGAVADRRSEEYTSELQSLMRISYAVFCLKKKKRNYISQRDNR